MREIGLDYPQTTPSIGEAARKRGTSSTLPDGEGTRRRADLAAMRPV